MKRASLLDGVTGLVSVATISFGVWVALAGPRGPLPIHYNAAGEVDRWGDRLDVGGLLILMGMMAALLGGLLGLAAARTDDSARRRGLRVAQAVALIGAAGTAGLVAGVSLSGAPQLEPAWPMALLSLLIAAVGAFAGRVAPNPLVGVRTPWTYKSRLAWDRSNRLAGRLMFWLGLIGLALAPFSPQPAGLVGLVVAILLAAAWSVIESWRVWRNDPDRQPF